MSIAETMVDTVHFSCPWEMWAGKDASWMVVGNALMFLASVAPSRRAREVLRSSIKHNHDLPASTFYRLCQTRRIRSTYRTREGLRLISHENSLPLAQRDGLLPDGRTAFSRSRTDTVCQIRVPAILCRSHEPLPGFLVALSCQKPCCRSKTPPVTVHKLQYLCRPL